MRKRTSAGKVRICKERLPWMVTGRNAGIHADPASENLHGGPSTIGQWRRPCETCTVSGSPESDTLDMLRRGTGESCDFDLNQFLALCFREIRNLRDAENGEGGYGDIGAMSVGGSYSKIPMTGLSRHGRSRLGTWLHHLWILIGTAITFVAL